MAKMFETKIMIAAKFSVRNMRKVLFINIRVSYQYLEEEINDEFVDKKKNDGKKAKYVVQKRCCTDKLSNHLCVISGERFLMREGNI